jgi:hypothetical protein
VKYILAPYQRGMPSRFKCMSRRETAYSGFFAVTNLLLSFCCACGLFAFHPHFFIARAFLHLP